MHTTTDIRTDTPDEHRTNQVPGPRDGRDGNVTPGRSLRVFLTAPVELPGSFDAPTAARRSERLLREPSTTPLARARAAGITAAWTGTCSATVELARLEGPHAGAIPGGFPTALPGSPPWDVSDTDVRVALYRWALTEGTQFDIYRWVNLADLAEIWPLLALPDGIHEEWQMVLRAAGLIETA